MSRLAKVPHALSGAGGFIDILHRVKRIIFCGTLTAGGIQVEVKDGGLRIQKEGKVIKCVRDLQHRTFDAAFALEKVQEVIYITERAVFRLQSEGLILAEMAPGVEIKRDIQPMVQFDFQVSPDLKRMEGRIFRPEPMGLKVSAEWK